MKAQQIDLLLIGLGVAYSGGTASFYAAGTSTPQYAYTDKDESSSFYTIVLDANGRATAYGDGWYKITVVDSDGANSLTFDNVYYGILEQTDTRSGGVVEKTDNYPIVTTDDYVIGNCSTKNIVFTLPDLTSFSENIRIVCVKSDATVNTLTVDGYGTQTIDGNLTYVLQTQYIGLVVYPNAAHTGWMVESIPLDTNGMIKDSYLKSVAPVGAIFAYPSLTAPAGFLICDGASYLNSTYPALSAVIRGTYGGSDANHFYVPQMLGRTIIGAGTGPGLSARTLGTSGGEETHVLTNSELSQHAHDEYDSAGHSIQQDGSSVSSYTWDITIGTTNANGVARATGIIGGDAGHNNMQPYHVLSYIIKT